MVNGGETPEWYFVAAMRELRTKLGWSQERLAVEVQKRADFRISPSSITKLEWLLDEERSDARSLRVNEAYAIARTLDSTVQAMASPDQLGRDIVGIRAMMAGELAAARETEVQLLHQLDSIRSDIIELQRRLESFTDFAAAQRPADIGENQREYELDPLDAPPPTAQRQQWLEEVKSRDRDAAIATLREHGVEFPGLDPSDPLFDLIAKFTAAAIEEAEATRVEHSEA